MKVIGAGLPRTGTLTQKVALEMLGLGPCYHMVNVLGNLDLVPQWRRALTGDIGWDELFAGFQSSVDWPGSFFYTELAEAYPEAKVVLSVRSAESWERSMRDTIWGVLYGDILIRDLARAWGRIEPRWRAYTDLMTEMWERSGLIEGGDHAEPGALARQFDRYNEEVMRTIPADRLLVWSVADGWEPLCDFLEVPVPAAPFPHLNDSKQFADRIVDGALLALRQWRAQDQEAQDAAAQESHPAATSS